MQEQSKKSASQSPPSKPSVKNVSPKANPIPPSPNPEPVSHKPLINGYKKTNYTSIAQKTSDEKPNLKDAFLKTYSPSAVIEDHDPNSLLESAIK